MSVIKIDKLWEKYRIKFILAGRVSWEEVWALEDISLDIGKGEIIGVIGQNGAGKTTFLRLLAGMLVPDKGEISVDGRVGAIMDLGAGLNPEFTGRENISLNARVYGIAEGVLKEKIDEIISFSNLGKFIDAPIKYYSQGMYMRLAFALAIFAEPDILLIDDILAVGDEEAQQKCRRKIVELKESGKTIVLVSHDMGIVSRLCDRVVLLDKGRILRVGPAKSVIPYYLEAAGENKGIACLEQQGLRVVFNNGRLSISYSGNYISGSAGGYSTSFDSLLKIHSPSTNLDWRIVSNSGAELAAEGASNEDGASLQHFKITLNDDILDISIRNAEVSGRQHNFNLFLSLEYNNWILPDKEGVFPAFSHRVNWHDLGLDIAGQNLGISAGPDSLLPGLIFQRPAQNSSLKVFNSGYEQESRIIHLSSTDNRELSLNIKICLKREDFDNYFFQERQALLIRRQEEQAREIEKARLAQIDALRRQQEEERIRIAQEKLAKEEAARKELEERESYLRAHTISGGDCRLFVDKEKGSLRIYFKDKEVTSLGGINSIFPLKDLIDYRWHIEKQDQSQLLLSLEFDSLKQFWNLKFRQDNTLAIKIVIETQKEVSIANRFIRLELAAGYNFWQTPHEEGMFSDSQYLDGISPARLKDVRVFQAAASSEAEGLPRVVFEALGENSQYVIGIFRQLQQGQEASCLSFSPVLPWSDKPLAVGRHDFFEGRIIFNSQGKLEDKHKEKSCALIDSQKLQFSFDRGKGNIIWRGKTLSSGLGVYTSLRVQNIWYDSSQAAWEYLCKDKQQITVKGFWPYIPVAQVWNLKFISEDILSWEVDMEIYAQVNIELEQASIMLIKEYKKWAAGTLAKGDFLDEFPADYDILPFRYWYGLVENAGLKVWQPGLPEVIFTNTMGNRMPKGLLENSDRLYDSRVLQYQRYNGSMLVPGKYAYFSGLIKIEDR